jgi:hypothetical protein
MNLVEACIHIISRKPNRLSIIIMHDIEFLENLHFLHSITLKLYLAVEMKFT